MDYVRLKDLVGNQFTIEKVWGFKWKKWNNDEKRMDSSDTYVEGYRKIYEVDTDQGKLDLGSGQIGSLLEAVLKNGISDLNGMTFKVKSNGKEGMDIRYFFNPEWTLKTEAVQQETKEVEDDIDPEDIPF